jgi:hypothetical protein
MMLQNVATMKNKIATFIANHMPARIVYWAVIRAGVHCTTGKYSSQVVPDLCLPDLLKRFDSDHGI